MLPRCQVPIGLLPILCLLHFLPACTHAAGGAADPTCSSITLIDPLMTTYATDASDAPSTAASTAAPGDVPAAGSSGKANIVLVLLDDADGHLGASPEDYNSGILGAMPATRRLVGAEGATFAAFYVNSPICCPSRVELLTGRYFHNVGGPAGTCQGADSAEVFGPLALFPLMQRAGYETIVVGKVTNDQGKFVCGGSPPPGISAMDSLCQYKCV